MAKATAPKKRAVKRARRKTPVKTAKKAFGNQWGLATHTENPREIDRRARAAMAGKTP
jgi:hypothetical protein